ncbi:hypothetical protein DUU90_19915 [Salmonella enterica subsp. enterica]|nr:hypothetical protein [Salmonella enterica subsp. enterica serovar Brunei]EAM2899344.1 hypothetical protein [Salmonella enterica]EBP4393324.1 hypothetical protein [Salmonella enterica subsp. enterica]EBV5391435.1 hypothetical protein [Salmonella enterica subsp. enterica serovar Tananarive]EDB4177749.1 hypothetical protein [Salmonella enterica subsp. enterica serovar Poona]
MATLLTKRRHIYFNIKIKWIHLKLKIIVITLNAGITRQLFLKLFISVLDNERQEKHDAA